MIKYIYYIFLPILFYPLYFIVVNTADTLFGEQQLINWLYFDSRLILLKTFLRDWLSSLPVMYVFFYALMVPITVLFKKYTASPVVMIYFTTLVIVALGSYTIGFKELGMIVNVVAAFFMMTLHLLMQSHFRNDL